MFEFCTSQVGNPLCLAGSGAFYWKKDAQNAASVFLPLQLWHSDILRCIKHDQEVTVHLSWAQNILSKAIKFITHKEMVHDECMVYNYDGPHNMKYLKSFWFAYANVKLSVSTGGSSAVQASSLYVWLSLQPDAFVLFLLILWRGYE